MDTLALLDQAVQMLAQVKSVAEAKRIIDIAASAQEYARRQKLGADAEMYGAEIRIRATRRLGEILKETERRKGSRGQLRGDVPRGTKLLAVEDDDGQQEPPSLDDLGLTRDESSQAQKLAALAEEIFEERLAAGREALALSLAQILKPKPHVSRNSGENEWYTPPEYLESARRVLEAIELDPASSPQANETVQAETYYTVADDGLSRHWQGKVWMNPPYAERLVARFVAKLLKHFQAGDVSEAIVLVNNATETEWGQALLGQCQAACFVKGRVRYLAVDGVKNTPLQGQMLCYLGDNAEGFSAEFDSHGTVLTPI